jgi:hypothetical protein
LLTLPHLQVLACALWFFDWQRQHAGSCIYVRGVMCSESVDRCWLLLHGCLELGGTQAYGADTASAAAYGVSHTTEGLLTLLDAEQVHFETDWTRNSKPQYAFAPAAHAQAQLNG